VGVADDWLLIFVGIAAVVVVLSTKAPASEADVEQARQDLISAVRAISEIGAGISLAVQGERLSGQTKNVARHLARLLALGAVGGVPSGEPPKKNDDDDKHWWNEIKGSLKQIQQAIKGASRKQVLRELLKFEWTEEEITEITAKLAEAAKIMGEETPPFLP